MNHSIFKSKIDTLVFLGLNSSEALKYLQKSPSFSEPIKLSNARKSPVFFDTQKLVESVEIKKYQRPKIPIHFSKIKAQEEYYLTFGNQLQQSSTNNHCKACKRYTSPHCANEPITVILVQTKTQSSSLFLWASLLIKILIVVMPLIQQFYFQ